VGTLAAMLDRPLDVVLPPWWPDSVRAASLTSAFGWLPTVAVAGPDQSRVDG
jgi:hypothetical protein